MLLRRRVNRLRQRRAPSQRRAPQPRRRHPRRRRSLMRLRPHLRLGPSLRLAHPSPEPSSQDLWLPSKKPHPSQSRKFPTPRLQPQLSATSLRFNPRLRRAPVPQWSRSLPRLRRRMPSLPPLHPLHGPVARGPQPRHRPEGGVLVDLDPATTPTLQARACRVQGLPVAVRRVRALRGRQVAQMLLHGPVGDLVLTPE